jgi:hypothetical protein
MNPYKLTLMGIAERHALRTNTWVPIEEWSNIIPANRPGYNQVLLWCPRSMERNNERPAVALIGSPSTIFRHHTHYMIIEPPSVEELNP